MFLPVGCGSSGGDGLAQFVQQLRGCSEDGLSYIVALTLIMEPVIDAIQDGDEFPGLTVDETDEDQDIWSFNYLADLDNDGVPETTVSGSIDFSEDPTDGIANGATATINFNVAGAEFIAGGGTLNTTYGANGASTTWGGGSLSSDDCDTTFSIPQGSPINFDTNDTEPMANLFGGEIYGSLLLTVDIGGHDLEATLTMTMGSETIQATDVEIDGAEAGDFSFDVEFDEERLSEVFECAFGTLLGLQEVLETLQAVALGVLGGSFEGDLETTPVPGNPLATAFTATVDGTTITGTIALGGIPVPNAPISATITFEYDDGNLLASATSGNPLVIQGTLNGDGNGIDDVLVHGRVATQYPDAGGDGLDCDGVVTIPSTNPVSINFFDSEGDVNEGAIMLIEVDFLGDNLKLAIASIEDGDDVDFFPVGVLFNNLPIPFSLLELG